MFINNQYLIFIKNLMFCFWLEIVMYQIYTKFIISLATFIK